MRQRAEEVDEGRLVVGRTDSIPARLPPMTTARWPSRFDAFGIE
jgi:hypothetical protein